MGEEPLVGVNQGVRSLVLGRQGADGFSTATGRGGAGVTIAGGAAVSSDGTRAIGKVAGRGVVGACDGTEAGSSASS